MANQISIIIQAQDKASPAIANLSKSLDGVTAAAGKSNSVMAAVRENWGAIAGIAVTLGAGVRSLAGYMGDSVNEANRLQSALTGLNSVARAFNQDAVAAKRAAQELAADGLMTVADSATGLKNLLASGFNLDQAVTLMKRFKDSSAFGRQAALSFGQAVASATEGVKNGNSILVDNAGVTKNLSLMLKEAGFSEQDLMKATSDANIRQALFNGIMKETNAQVGDAARLSEQFAGKQAQAGAQVIVLKQQIGEALQPALAAMLDRLVPMVQVFATFTEQHPQIVAAVLLITTGVLALAAGVGAVSLAVAGLTPLWTVMAAAGTASIAAVSGPLAVLKTVLATPLVMPAIVVAAALASLAEVSLAIVAIKRAIDDVNNAADSVKSAASSDDSVLGKLKHQQRYGATQADRDRATAKIKKLAETGAFATGTNYAPGGPAELAEEGPELVFKRGVYNVPRGATVLTARETAKAIGGHSMTNIFNIHNQIDMDAAVAQLGWRLTS